MKRQLLLFTLLFSGGLSEAANAQNICLVTASSGGQDYIIYWEPFADYTGLDSMLIFRKQPNDLSFEQVGSVKLGPTESTYFTDENVSTILPTKYAIAIRDDLGDIGVMSPWHQGIVMDYLGNGAFNWTAYQKEDQVDESYITGYECMMDPSGTGGYTSMGGMPNTQLSWNDANFQSHTNGSYYIIAELPACEYQEKANINTSRSNIKQQISNGQSGVEEHTIEGISFEVVPNPVTDQLVVQFNTQQEVQLWVSDASGAIVQSDRASGMEWVADVHELPAGVYFVNVKHEGVVSTKRFVKH